MHRATRNRPAPLYAIALAAFLVAAFAVPAFAHHPDRGGKKAIGEVASFDGTTLTVTRTDGSTFTSAVADDVKVKVEHRGHKEHGKGHSKPSNGTTADLVAGAQVLKVKVRCDEVTKVRIRRAPAEATVAPAEPVDSTDDTESDDTESDDTESEATDDATEGEVTTASDDADDDGCSSDEDVAEEAEADTEGDAADNSDDDEDETAELVEDITEALPSI
jgi:hypothetical protein